MPGSLEPGIFITWTLQPDMSFQLLRLVIVSIVLVLGTVQCQQAVPPPTATPAPTPTPQLIPPIQPGDGTDLMDALLERGVIRVGIRVWPEAMFSPPAFRGFSNAAIGGALNGYEVDVARLIATHLGLELEFVEAYPPIIAGGDWRGEWDIALASLVPFDAPLQDTVVQPLYSRPYGYMPGGILVPGDSSINSITQLNGQRVGVFEHSVYQRLLTPNETLPTVYGQSLINVDPVDIQLVVLSNMQKTIREMAAPKGDSNLPAAVFGPAPVLDQAVTESDLPFRVIRDPALLPPHPLVIAAVPQGNLTVNRLVLEIDNSLERLYQQGTLAELSLRWYGQDLSRPQ
jgi:ABC-type amino acid transport substrate-binding protein